MSMVNPEPNKTKSDEVFEEFSKRLEKMKAEKGLVDLKAKVLPSHDDTVVGVLMTMNNVLRQWMENPNPQVDEKFLAQLNCRA